MRTDLIIAAVTACESSRTPNIFWSLSSFFVGKYLGVANIFSSVKMLLIANVKNQTTVLPVLNSQHQGMGAIQEVGKKETVCAVTESGEVRGGKTQAVAQTGVKLQQTTLESHCNKAV